MKKLIIKSDTYGTHEVLYSDRYHKIVSKYTWWLHKCSNTIYVKTMVKNKKVIYLHRLLLNFPDKVDHRNGNGLDNRRSNIRPATNSQNSRNSSKKSNNTSGYKGVSYDKRDEKFYGRITVDGKVLSLGYHDTAESAAIAYNKAAKKHYKEFAKLNIINNKNATSH